MYDYKDKILKHIDGFVYNNEVCYVNYKDVDLNNDDKTLLIYSKIKNTPIGFGSLKDVLKMEQKDVISFYK